MVHEAEWTRKLDNLKADSGRQEILIRENYGKEGSLVLEGLASLAGLHLYESKSLPGLLSAMLLCAESRLECAIFIFCAVMRTERERGRWWPSANRLCPTTEPIWTTDTARRNAR